MSTSLGPLQVPNPTGVHRLVDPSGDILLVPRENIQAVDVFRMTASEVWRAGVRLHGDAGGGVFLICQGTKEECELAASTMAREVWAP